MIRNGMAGRAADNESLTPAQLALVELLVEQRLRQTQRPRGYWFRQVAFAVAPVAAFGMLSASAPSTGASAVEARLRVLESLITIGPDGSAQASAPFQVTDARGKVLFAVGDRAVPAAVNVTPFAGSSTAALRVLNSRGGDAASLLVDPDGYGRITNFDAAGKVVAQFNSAGLNVYGADGEANAVAGVTRGNGQGRVAVWRKGNVAAELTADAQGNGRAMTNFADGKESAGMGSMRPNLTGLAVFHNQANVVSIVSRSGRGVIGVARDGATNLIAEMTVDSSGGGVLHMKGPEGKVAVGLYGRTRTIALGNGEGKTVAEMTVHPRGSGLFQIWDGGNTPLALMGKSADRGAGIVQISNGRAIISSLTADGSGDGYLQINDASGTPMLEAGVQDNGLGTIRAGPQFECIHRMTQGIQRLPDCIRGKK